MKQADGSYYYSITIPALIVATYGGGTGLPTQRECLELLGCYGPGRVRKLAGTDPRREIRQVAHRASQPLQLLLGNIITRGQRCVWVGCGGRCVCCGFWS